MKEARRRARREHRRDEESLYYLLERDLDSGALFPFSNGWYPQVSVGRNRVDFVLKYGDRLLGVEVKFGFPKRKDFEQAERYRPLVDAIYLAYPSDRAGEALFLSESKEFYPDIGLISVALFRTHCIRPALVRKRETDRLWRDSNYYFDMDDFAAHLRELRDSPNTTVRRSLSVLHESRLLFEVDQDGRFEQGRVFRHRVPLKEWQELAALYALWRAGGPLRDHTQDDLDKTTKRLGWRYGYFDLLLQTPLVYKQDYGTNLTTYSFTDAGLACEADIRIALKRELGLGQWRKVLRRTREMKAEFEAHQRAALEQVVRYK